MNDRKEWYGMNPKKPFPMYDKKLLGRIKRSGGTLPLFASEAIGKRNKWICYNRKQGWSWDDLAEFFDLKPDTIREIVRKLAPWLLHDTEDEAKEKLRKENERELNRILRDQSDMSWLDPLPF